MKINKIPVPTLMISAGIVFAVVASALTHFGNPANMGLCVACFLRDTAGALGMHGSAQYIRPEIIGILIGSSLTALVRKEFNPTGGSSPVLRFLLGICVMVGALIFLGCPTRLILRMAGGDLNALVALPGFFGGVAVGAFFINRGFTLGQKHKQSPVEGGAISFVSVILLILFLVVPAIFMSSDAGLGALRAAWYIALTSGAFIGGIGFLSRFCFVGGVRDGILYKSFTMPLALLAMLLTGIVINIFTGNFNLGFYDQPIAHSDHIWNFLGMLTVGFGSALLGGCPFRQLVKAGSGDSDSAVTIFGMMTGAAIVHNFDLASSPGGASGKVIPAFGFSLLIILVIAVLGTIKGRKTA